MAEPGSADLSVDVDFASLKDHMTKESGKRQGVCVCVCTFRRPRFNQSLCYPFFYSFLIIGVTTNGPVTQSEFLQSLGIQVRMEMLLKNAASRPARNNIIEGFKRLLDPAAMGRIYKVLAFSKEQPSSGSKKSIEEARPVGFHHLD